MVVEGGKIKKVNGRRLDIHEKVNKHRLYWQIPYVPGAMIFAHLNKT